ncbi:MAG: ABC transporter ATP-binding protein [Dysgonamonadaceae bacterium]|jgi:ABC-2 type transport system ATP-binding protein|nr:ABC transporter ATP-binding protein [Dysgonamonadaceae bacterium]
MEIIHFEKVNFSYNKKRPLLSGLSLQLQPGHIHGLLGKNGEGKSTLLKLVAGLLFPQKGTIETMGFEPQKRKPEMLRDIYFISEELPLFPLSIEKFEKVYAPFYPNFSHSQFDNYLKEFEISSKELRINKLSYGQKKKVTLAFGLAAQTKVLLMDEPTNGLDIPSKGQFRRIVASSLENDRCIIISTHQVRDLDSLIDSIIIMDEHEIVFNELIKNITDKLLFKVYDTNVKDASVIYSEDTLRGFYQVRENREQEDSKLDIELLFNAVHANKKQIKELFTNTLNH